MDTSTAVTDFEQLVRNALQGLAEFLPSLLGALLLLAIGWIAARLAKTAAVQLGRLVERALQRLAAKRGAKAPPSISASVLGSAVFWIVMLIFLTAATQVLGLELFTEWMNRVVEYLPTLLAGVLILVAGVLASAVARDLVVAAVPLAERQRTLFGGLAQGTVLVTAAIIGADQIGIDVTFIVVVAAVVLGILLGGLALAAGLGARELVQNLVAAQQVRQLYQAGDRIRLGEQEGRIAELTPTSVLLDTADGRLALPAQLFLEQPSLLLLDRTDE
jgi:small-conductance mechanosensitive channel